MADRKIPGQDGNDESKSIQESRTFRNEKGDYPRLVNHFFTIPHKPLFPFGSTVRSQCGHGTGAESAVACHSMSGATKVLPQCGHVTTILPLTISKSHFEFLPMGIEKLKVGFHIVQLIPLGFSNRSRVKVVNPCIG